MRPEKDRVLMKVLLVPGTRPGWAVWGIGGEEKWGQQRIP